MSKDNRQSRGKQGLRGLDADQIAQKRRTAQQAQGQLVKMNQRFPDLASDFVRKAVEQWKPGLVEAGVVAAEPGAAVATRRSSAPPALPGRSRSVPPDLEALVAEMAVTQGVEEVLETLAIDHAVDIDALALAHLVGNEVYSDMLRRELRFLKQYFLSAEQVAELWNESGLVVPGGGIWTKTAVERLLENAASTATPDAVDTLTEVEAGGDA